MKKQIKKCLQYNVERETKENTWNQEKNVGALKPHVHKQICKLLLNIHDFLRQSNNSISLSAQSAEVY